MPTGLGYFRFIVFKLYLTKKVSHFAPGCPIRCENLIANQLARFYMMATLAFDLWRLIFGVDNTTNDCHIVVLYYSYIGCLNTTNKTFSMIFA